METSSIVTVTVRPMRKTDLEEADRIFHAEGYNRPDVFALDDWR